MVDPRHYPAGGVYYIADEAVRLPGESEERSYHATRRRVLIVSDQGERHATNRRPAAWWPSVLVVPISTSRKYKTQFDVLIPRGEGGLAADGWARVPALQVMDKSFLTDMSGVVSKEILDAVTAQILNYLGIIDPEDDPLTDLDF